MNLPLSCFCRTKHAGVPNYKVEAAIPCTAPSQCFVRNPPEDPAVQYLILKHMDFEKVNKYPRSVDFVDRKAFLEKITMCT